MNEIERTGGVVASRAASEVSEGQRTSIASHGRSRRRGIPWRAVLWATVAVCLVGVLLPAVRVVTKADLAEREGAGRAICRVLWRMGLPPIGESLWAVWGLDPSEGGKTENPQETESASETDTPEETAEAVTDPEETDAEDTTDTAEETTAEPLPDGAIPVVRQDVSESHRGVDYLHNPAALPVFPFVDERLWSTAGTPAVLIVHSHPREAYGDGGDYVVAGEDGMALAPAGKTEGSVVALGVSLTEKLRAQGITVIHLRTVAEAGESYADTYERTERRIRYYTTLYPDIGLVLDLRRSAESADVGILATQGTVAGTDSAQLRITVDGLRGEAEVSRDVAVAQALRAGLWAVSPTLCRPVYLRRSAGLGERCAEAVVLTLELGAAGNIYAEAEALVEPLASALAEMLKG